MQAVEPPIASSLLPDKYDDRATFTAKEAATLLGVSQNTLYRAIWRKEVGTIPIGARNYAINRREMLRLLTEGISHE